MSGVGVLAFPLMILVYIAAAVAGVWLVIKILSGLGWLVGALFTGVGRVIGHVFGFARNEISDVVRAAGGMLTALIFAPLVGLNVVIGRWSKATHYGAALESELATAGQALYRAVVGNPARLLGLTGLTEGLERRLPEVLAHAPGPDRPNRRTGEFEGYKVVGSLPSGGSGARLFLAEPGSEKLEQFRRLGRTSPRRVVIKSFSLADGSTMPQIVRESRALEAARQLGLVVEHELTSNRFHYVMPYVPGDDLSITTRRMHESCGADGLDDRRTRLTLAYAADLLGTLRRFHGSGLWHKDVKPSNIIISDGQVHLVDLGLMTPLQSAMTLTTHGTEYFRDPEMVRLALKGVKVHEVDGVKFDVYSAGAVLFSVLENSFPAHGSLSKITKRCPEALRWIVRRAMADMNNRYGSSAEMLADIEAVRSARNPFKVLPAELPSVSGRPHVVAEVEADTRPDAEPLGADPWEDHRRRWGWGGSTRRQHQAAATKVAQQGDKAAGKVKRPSRTHGALRGLVGGAAALLIVAVFLGGAMRHQYEQQNREVARSGPRFELPVTGHETVWAPTPSRAVPHARGRSTPLPLGDGRRVLLVDDLSSSATARVHGEFDEIAGLLNGAGFAVLGTGDSPLDDEQEISLLASARSRVGLSDPFIEESGPPLMDFVSEQGEAVEALLWFGSGPDENSYRVRLVAPDTETRDALRVIVSHAQRP